MEAKRLVLTRVLVRRRQVLQHDRGPLGDRHERRRMRRHDDRRRDADPGCLDELQTDQGINVEKYRSFELYRRSTSRPEIITFDELYHRAKFIVEHVENSA